MLAMVVFFCDLAQPIQWQKHNSALQLTQVAKTELFMWAVQLLSACWLLWFDFDVWLISDVPLIQFYTHTHWFFFRVHLLSLRCLSRHEWEKMSVCVCVCSCHTDALSQNGSPVSDPSPLTSPEPFLCSHPPFLLLFSQFNHFLTAHHTHWTSDWINLYYSYFRKV